MEADYNRNNKYPRHRTGEYLERSEGLQNCEFLVHLVWSFGVDRIKKLKLKGLKLMLHYFLGSENLKGVPNKVELLEDVNEFFRKDWEDIVQREGGGISVVTNGAGCEAGKDTG